MPSFTMTIIGITILAVIAVLIAVFLFTRGLIPINPPLPGSTEEARFMNYMSCSIAMCSGKAPDMNGVKDICNSPEVLSVVLENDGGKIKSCNSICEDLKLQYGVKDKYCDKTYAIPFTFKEDVKYNGNNDNCQLKGGWQTDVSCYSGWKGGILDCTCWGCNGDRGPEGILFKTYGDCGRVGLTIVDDWSSFPGAIWIPKDYADKYCTSWNTRDHRTWEELRLSECNFGKNTFYIWAEQARTHSAWFCLSCGSCTACDYPWQESHGCSQIIICDHKT